MSANSIEKSVINFHCEANGENFLQGLDSPLYIDLEEFLPIEKQTPQNKEITFTSSALKQESLDDSTKKSQTIVISTLSNFPSNLSELKKCLESKENLPASLPFLTSNEEKVFIKHLMFIPKNHKVLGMINLWDLFIQLQTKQYYERFKESSVDFSFISSKELLDFHERCQNFSPVYAEVNLKVSFILLNIILRNAKEISSFVSTNKNDLTIYLLVNKNLANNCKNKDSIIKSVSALLYIIKGEIISYTQIDYIIKIEELKYSLFSPKIFKFFNTEENFFIFIQQINAFFQNEVSANYLLGIFFEVQSIAEFTLAAFLNLEHKGNDKLFLSDFLKKISMIEKFLYEDEDINSLKTKFYYITQKLRENADIHLAKDCVLALTYFKPFIFCRNFFIDSPTFALFKEQADEFAKQNRFFTHRSILEYLQKHLSPKIQEHPDMPFSKSLLLKILYRIWWINRNPYPISLYDLETKWYVCDHFDVERPASQIFNEAQKAFCKNNPDFRFNTAAAEYFIADFFLELKSKTTEKQSSIQA